MVRIDEARHDDAAGGVDHRGGARMQVRPDGKDLLALDQHVGPREVADLRVQRHHRTAADEVTPARPAAVGGRIPSAGRRRTRRKQIQTRSCDPGRRHTLQKIAPRAEMVPKASFIAQFAHAGVSPDSANYLSQSRSIGRLRQPQSARCSARMSTARSGRPAERVGLAPAGPD